MTHPNWITRPPATRQAGQTSQTQPSPLDCLTARETAELWTRITRATGDLAGEITHLIRCPAQLRGDLYGPGVLDAMQTAYRELCELAASLESAL